MIGVILILSALIGVALIARAVTVEIRTGGGLSVRDLRQFSEEFDERLAHYMKANYRGHPAQLEATLRGFLPIAEEMAAKHPEPIDADLIRTLIVTAVTSQRLARRDEVESALDSIRHTEERAAA